MSCTLTGALEIQLLGCSPQHFCSSNEGIGLQLPHTHHEAVPEGGGADGWLSLNTSNKSSGALSIVCTSKSRTSCTGIFWTAS